MRYRRTVAARQRRNRRLLRIIGFGLPGLTIALVLGTSLFGRHAPEISPEKPKRAVSVSPPKPQSTAQTPKRKARTLSETIFSRDASVAPQPSPNSHLGYSYPPDGKQYHLDQGCLAVENAISEKTGISSGCDWNYTVGPDNPPTLTVHVIGADFAQAHVSRERIYEIAAEALAVADSNDGRYFNPVPNGEVIVDQ